MLITCLLIILLAFAALSSLAVMLSPLLQWCLSLFKGKSFMWSTTFLVLYGWYSWPWISINIYRVAALLGASLLDWEYTSSLELNSLITFLFQLNNPALVAYRSRVLPIGANSISVFPVLMLLRIAIWAKSSCFYGPLQGLKFVLSPLILDGWLTFSWPLSAYYNAPTSWD